MRGKESSTENFASSSPREEEEQRLERLFEGEKGEEEEEEEEERSSQVSSSCGEFSTEKQTAAQGGPSADNIPGSASSHRRRITLPSYPPSPCCPLPPAPSSLPAHLLPHNPPSNFSPPAPPPPPPTHVCFGSSSLCPRHHLPPSAPAASASLLSAAGCFCHRPHSTPPLPAGPHHHPPPPPPAPQPLPLCSHTSQHPPQHRGCSSSSSPCSPPPPSGREVPRSRQTNPRPHQNSLHADCPDHFGPHSSSASPLPPSSSSSSATQHPYFAYVPEADASLRVCGHASADGPRGAHPDHESLSFFPFPPAPPFSPSSSAFFFPCYPDMPSASAKNFLHLDHAGDAVEKDGIRDSDGRAKEREPGGKEATLPVPMILAAKKSSSCGTPTSTPTTRRRSFVSSSSTSRREPLLPTTTAAAPCSSSSFSVEGLLSVGGANSSSASSSSLAARAEAKKREEQLVLWERLQEVRRQRHEVYVQLAQLGEGASEHTTRRGTAMRSDRRGGTLLPEAPSRQSSFSSSSFCALRPHSAPVTYRPQGADGREGVEEPRKETMRKNRNSCTSLFLEGREEEGQGGGRGGGGGGRTDVPARSSSSAIFCYRERSSVGSPLPRETPERSIREGFSDRTGYFVKVRKEKNNKDDRYLDRLRLPKSLSAPFLVEEGRANKRKKKKPWDDSLSDLSRYRATRSDLLTRRLRSTSPHAAIASEEYRQRLLLMERNLRPFLDAYKSKFSPDCKTEEERKLEKKEKLKLYRLQRASSSSICALYQGRHLHSCSSYSSPKMKQSSSPSPSSSRPGWYCSSSSSSSYAISHTPSKKSLYGNFFPQSSLRRPRHASSSSPRPRHQKGSSVLDRTPRTPRISHRRERERCCSSSSVLSSSSDRALSGKKKESGGREEGRKAARDSSETKKARKPRTSRLPPRCGCSDSSPSSASPSCAPAAGEGRRRRETFSSSASSSASPGECKRCQRRVLKKRRELEGRQVANIDVELCRTPRGGARVSGVRTAQLSPSSSSSPSPTPSAGQRHVRHFQFLHDSSGPRKVHRQPSARSHPRDSSSSSCHSVSERRLPVIRQGEEEEEGEAFERLATRRSRQSPLREVGGGDERRRRKEEAREHIEEEEEGLIGKTPMRVSGMGNSEETLNVEEELRLLDDIAQQLEELDVSFLPNQHHRQHPPHLFSRTVARRPRQDEEEKSRALLLHQRAERKEGQPKASPRPLSSVFADQTEVASSDDSSPCPLSSLQQDQKRRAEKTLSDSSSSLSPSPPSGGKTSSASASGGTSSPPAAFASPAPAAPQHPPAGHEETRMTRRRRSGVHTASEDALPLAQEEGEGIVRCLGRREGDSFSSSSSSSPHRSSTRVLSSSFCSNEEDEEILKPSQPPSPASPLPSSSSLCCLSLPVSQCFSFPPPPPLYPSEQEKNLSFFSFSSSSPGQCFPSRSAGAYLPSSAHAAPHHGEKEEERKKKQKEGATAGEETREIIDWTEKSTKTKKRTKERTHSQKGKGEDEEEDHYEVQTQTRREESNRLRHERLAGQKVAKEDGELELMKRQLAEMKTQIEKQHRLLSLQQARPSSSSSLPPTRYRTYPISHLRQVDLKGAQKTSLSKPAGGGGGEEERGRRTPAVLEDSRNEEKQHGSIAGDNPCHDTSSLAPPQQSRSSSSSSSSSSLSSCLLDKNRSSLPSMMPPPPSSASSSLTALIKEQSAVLLGGCEAVVETILRQQRRLEEKRTRQLRKQFFPLRSPRSPAAHASSSPRSEETFLSPSRPLSNLAAEIRTAAFERDTHDRSLEEESEGERRNKFLSARPFSPAPPTPPPPPAVLLSAPETSQCGGREVARERETDGKTASSSSCSSRSWYGVEDRGGEAASPLGVEEEEEEADGEKRGLGSPRPHEKTKEKKRSQRLSEDADAGSSARQKESRSKSQSAGGEANDGRGIFFSPPASSFLSEAPSNVSTERIRKKTDSEAVERSFFLSSVRPSACSKPKMSAKSSHGKNAPHQREEEEEDVHLRRRRNSTSAEDKRSVRDVRQGTRLQTPLPRKEEDKKNSSDALLTERTRRNERHPDGTDAPGQDKSKEQKKKKKKVDSAIVILDGRGGRIGKLKNRFMTIDVEIEKHTEEEKKSAVTKKNRQKPSPLTPGSLRTSSSSSSARNTRSRTREIPLIELTMK